MHHRKVCTCVYLCIWVNTCIFACSAVQFMYSQTNFKMNGQIGLDNTPPFSPFVLVAVWMVIDFCIIAYYLNFGGTHFTAYISQSVWSCVHIEHALMGPVGISMKNLCNNILYFLTSQENEWNSSSALSHKPTFSLLAQIQMMLGKIHLSYTHLFEIHK